MALSRDARNFAAEIRNHDWSDAPWRLDRAGHSRADDTKAGPDALTVEQTRFVKTNVMWVVGQVLSNQDPNFDIYEFAEACGLKTTTASGRKNGGIAAGIRTDTYGRALRPGTWDVDPDEVLTTAASDFYHLADCEHFRRGWQGTPLQWFPIGAVPPRWAPCAHCFPAGQS
ncbi:hypothetical protein ACIA8O_00245 [Kitasatospora sp. NPDC051853]|uniref:hypothetical protein n=1 Tax=Kitasatospora sp. NPDC051853 TaxID=3364058 RepID=UPI0037B6EEE1